jgi:hypothetical protein
VTVTIRKDGNVNITVEPPKRDKALIVVPN